MEVLRAHPFVVNHQSTLAGGVLRRTPTGHLSVWQLWDWMQPSANMNPPAQAPKTEPNLWICAAAVATGIGTRTTKKRGNHAIRAAVTARRRCLRRSVVIPKGSTGNFPRIVLIPHDSNDFVTRRIKYLRGRKTAKLALTRACPLRSPLDSWSRRQRPDQIDVDASDALTASRRSRDVPATSSRHAYCAIPQSERGKKTYSRGGERRPANN
jgi:hypothetical protein